MKTTSLNALVIPLLLISGCVTTPKIEYHLLANPDPSMKIVRLLQNSQIGSSRTGSSHGFFYDPAHTLKDGINFKTTEELINFVNKIQTEQSIDALLIMVMTGPIAMYSGADVQLRNEAITACSKLGVKVFVQEIGGSTNRIFYARPSSPTPNP